MIEPSFGGMGLIKHIMTVLVFICLLLIPVKIIADVLPAVEVEKDRLSLVDQIYVNTFAFEGNTVFSDQELAEVVSGYQNRLISAEELQAVKKNLTLFYINNGYINSGVVIPDQNPSQDTILLKVIEGEISRMDISGNRHTRNKYIGSRILSSTANSRSPLNINQLQRRLKMIKQDRLFDNVNAELSPEYGQGSAILKIQVDEAGRYDMTTSFSNHKSPGVGSYYGNLTTRFSNISGWGDFTELQVGRTEGLDDISLYFDIPLNQYDTTISFQLDRSESNVISEPFSELDINGFSQTTVLSLRHPYYKMIDSEKAVGIKLEKHYSKTDLLGQPFSLSHGAENGVSEVTLIRLFHERIYRHRNQVVAVYFSLNKGMDALDATIQESGPDGQFINSQFQIQWFRQSLWKESQMLYKLDFQYSIDSLLDMEKFAAGGATSVRGYRENFLTSDSGICSSLEWRYPLMEMSLWGKKGKRRNGRQKGILHFIPFVDYARGWNENSSSPAEDQLLSMGFGLRWTIQSRFIAEIFWGKMLIDVDVSDEKDLQDDGLHFQIKTDFF